jgi:hypothetical protein
MAETWAEFLKRADLLEMRGDAGLCERETRRNKEKDFSWRL